MLAASSDEPAKFLLVDEPRRRPAGCFKLTALSLCLTALLLAARRSAAHLIGQVSGTATTVDSKGTIDVHLGNGCFWERQWVYYKVETEENGPFQRKDADVTALVGYAGGMVANASGPVCYHTGDARDYAAHGFAETVKVTLDAASAEKQLAALAKDFFGSFTGEAGQRVRPDPGDRGGAYRSVFGLPGGMASPLYKVFERGNAFRMLLKPGAGKNDGAGDPAENTVYVYDTNERPFYVAEEYHQFHCDFSMSSGMPYPESYWNNLFEQMKTSGRVKPTGCPEGVVPHPGALCSSPARIFPMFGRRSSRT